MMENQNKRFNDLVAKVKNGETTAPEAVWGKIESSLNKGNKRKAIYFWSLSVAMTILVASSSVYFFTNTVEKQNVLNASNLDKLEVKNDEGKRELQSPISKSQSKPELNPIYTESTSPIEKPERLFDDHKTSIENSEPEINSVDKTNVKGDYIPTLEELANQQKFSHNWMNPVPAKLESNELEDVSIATRNIEPINGEFTENQLAKAYRLFSIYAGYGIFDQNLIMANPHADTVSFRAEKGQQFNVGLQYNLSKNWAIDMNFGLSANEWSSAARLVVDETIAAAGQNAQVYMSTNFQFNEITNSNDVSEILNEKPGESDVRLLHKMKYTHYRLGFTYAINDFKHWDFRALLQAEYMQLRDVSTFFQAGDHSISYPVSGFKKGIWALRPGINIAYRLSDSFSVYTEGSTSVRGTYLMKHPNWKIYENQFGLFCGVRYTW
jgi:hypothetical protein